MLYGAVNGVVLGLVPGNARTLLDLGCGTGALGSALKRRQALRVTGVTFSAAEAAEAAKVLDDVEVGDLNTYTPRGGPYDCVVCSHVLEHLYDPGRLLRALPGVMAPGACLIVALPNVLHWRQRLRFLGGSFRYTEGGLMDSTHFRFFDWRTAGELLWGAGFEIEMAIADGTFPGSRFLGGLGKRLDRWSCRLAPGLFGFQFVFSARPHRR